MISQRLIVILMLMVITSPVNRAAGQQTASQQTASAQRENGVSEGSQSPPQENIKTNLPQAVPPGFSPHDTKSSLRNRVSYFDRTSVGRLWDLKMQRSDEESNQGKTEGEILLVLMKCNSQEKELIDQAFAKRKAAYIENFETLSQAIQAEDQVYYASGGDPGPELDKDDQSEANTKQIEKELKRYLDKEYEAEEALATSLAEILDPNQMQILVDRWIHFDNVSSPLVAKHLLLAEEQVSSIRDACYEFRKLHARLEAESGLRKQDNKQVTAPQQQVEWWDARFKMYSYFTPKQFQQVAHLLFNERDNTPNFFRKRHAIAQARVEKFPGSEIASSELRGLGELYRAGIQGEMP